MTSATGFQQQLSMDLIQRAKTGDMLAFGTIYDTYADASYNLAWRISNNKILAQDIVQEVFIKIINNIGSYRSEGSFAGWIRRIVANETINRIKLESRLHLVGEENIEDYPASNLFGHNWVNTCRELDNLVARLSITSRAVLLLHEVEGYNHKEIAKMYDKSESFSKVTLRRAHISLRKMILAQEQRSAFK